MKENNQKDKFTEGIKTILINEAIKEIEKNIMPDMHNRIEDIATEAVSKWTIRMNTMQDITGFDKITNVQINFIEEIFNQVVNESVTNITVNKGEVK